MNLAGEHTTEVMESSLTTETMVAGYHSQGLTLTVMKDFSEHPEIENEWNELVKDSSSTIYQTYEWLSTWWEYFGTQQQRSLHVVLIHHDHRLVGIAPLFFETTTLFNRPCFRHLSFIGSGMAFNRSFGMFLDDGPSDYLDIIVSPDYAESVAQCLCRYFQEQSSMVDEIEFLNLPSQSFVKTTLLPAMKASGFSCTETEADVCPRLTLQSSVPEFLQTLDSSVRRRLTQATKAGEEGTLFSLRPPTSQADVIATLNELMKLHQRRWRTLGYPGLFASERFTKFQFATTRAFMKQGWIWIKRAVSDDRTVAARLAFAFNGKLYDYLSGFDENAAAAKRRPGIALLLSMMKDALDNNIRVIDFLRGEEAYKFEMTSEASKNFNVTTTFLISKGTTHVIAANIARIKLFIGFLLAREWGLFRVQFDEHVFPSSLYYYAKFRSGRFLNKFFGNAAKPAPDQHSEQNQRVKKEKGAA